MSILLNFLNINKFLLLVVLISVVFFVFTASINLGVINPKANLINGDAANIKFNSPDEAANYFWTVKFTADSELYYFEPLNLPATDLIHLRGMNTVQGKITPGSFLGLPIIYGSLAKIFSPNILPYLTPFFAALATIFFYLLIKKIFNHEVIALISAVLLSFAPAWLYYSARGFYHNVLFISLLIVGVYILFQIFGNEFFEKSEIPGLAKFTPPRLAGQDGAGKNQKSKIISIYFLNFLSGLFIGLAIITRTSELVWIALTIILILAINLKKINLPGIMLFITGIWLPLLILFCQNLILYGAVISAGYRTVISETGLGEVIRSGILFQILITPFGLNLKASLINAFNYLYLLFPYWSVPTIAGGFLFLILPEHLLKIKLRARLIYLAYLFILTSYLIVFYGSWQFSDRLDRATLSLGTSYLRYWLPIYLIALPLLGTLIYQIARFLIPENLSRRAYYRFASIFMLIVLLAMPTINFVFRVTDESLMTLKNLSDARLKSFLVNKRVNADDVIITYKQADKILFSERPRLITELVVPSDYQALTELIKINKIYYYTYAAPADVSSISRQKFEPLGLVLINGQRVFGNDWLYQIKLLNDQKIGSQQQ